MKNPPCSSGAEFGNYHGNDQVYRWSLYRIWDPAKPTLAFCMLNPSTADAVKNDPTVERCERRARRGGFGKLVVVNLFALRSTDPKKLYLHPDPRGTPRNNTAIIRAAHEALFLVCAWGEHGKYLQRGREVMFLLREMKLSEKLRHLGLNASGEPKHPLYISFATRLQRF